MTQSMSFRFPNGFGIGVGSLVLVVNVVLLGGYVFGCHAFRHLVGGTFDQHLGTPCAAQALRLRELPERKTQEVGMGKPVLGGVFRYLRPPLLDGDLA